jgi:hypothetical protein
MDFNDDGVPKMALILPQDFHPRSARPAAQILADLSPARFLEQF